MSDAEKKFEQATRTSRWYDYYGSVGRWLWLEQLIAGESR